MTEQAEKNEEQRIQSLNLSQRRAINNAYAALISDQNTQTFAAFTFEDALDLQIERIEGNSGGKQRPNLLERTARIEGQLLKAVEQLKKVDPEQFLEPDERGDVNTPENTA
jgi:hypothetical protein